MTDSITDSITSPRRENSSRNMLFCGFDMHGMGWTGEIIYVPGKYTISANTVGLYTGLHTLFSFIMTQGKEA